MSIVAVHGPNTMFTTEGGGQAVLSNNGGLFQAVKSPTNGLSFAFSLVGTSAKVDADFDWTFTGPGSPAAQPDKKSGTVLFTGAGAGTIICTVSGTGTPAANTYTINVTATAGAPRMLKGGDDEEEAPPEEEAVVEEIPPDEAPEEEAVTAEDIYDPADYNVDEVKEYADSLSSDEDIQALLDAELEGKNRSTLTGYLVDLLPYDPNEHTVAEVMEYAEAAPDELDEIIEAERAGKNRSTLLSQLEALQTT